VAQLEWGSVTHEGQIRTANEDSLLVEPGVFVVADGMGGHQAGEVASALAVERIRRNLLGKPGVLDAVITAINDANADIHEAASGDETKQGMGTTVTALAVIATPNGDEALGLANVGDSRTYLFRHERLRPITVDHNYVQELIDSGQITPDEARQHPRRNIITRALGIESGVRVDAWTMPLVRGDRFLLCSDGLVDEVTDEDIAHVLATHPDPQRTAERLVEMANDSGGRDNITVIVVDVLDGSEPPAHDEMDLEPIWATTGAGATAGAGAGSEDTTEEVAIIGETAPGETTPDEADLIAVANVVEAVENDRRKQAGADAGNQPEPEPRGFVADELPPEPDETRARPAATSATSATAGTEDTATADGTVKTKRRLGRFFAAVLLAAILVAGFVIFAAWARRGYYMAFDDSGDVVIYKGHKDGVLWFDPTEQGRSSLGRDRLDEESIARVEAEPEFESQASAERYLNDVLTPTTTTTTTTTTTAATTSTTAPRSTTTEPRSTTTRPGATPTRTSPSRRTTPETSS
jgi:serine/threonine protein phosphatase PrpC/cell division septation protein DedD